jgi:hypothetical protein
MAGVFVSYRRDDSQGFAGRLADDLGEILGGEWVFRDIEIPVGSDFTEVLHNSIAASDALLVVIGRHWASQSEHGFGRRLFAPTDWVRAEIESAFSLGKQVVPVLVGGATMPTADVLPKSIERLTRLQAAVLTDRRWDAEVSDLAERLRALCPALDAARRQSSQKPPDSSRRRPRAPILDEAPEGRAPRIKKPSLLGNLAREALRATGRGLKKLMSFVLVVGLVYGAIRLFGDESTLRALDRVEARLQVGWERLQAYIARL